MARQRKGANPLKRKRSPSRLPECQSGTGSTPSSPEKKKVRWESKAVDSTVDGTEEDDDSETDSEKVRIGACRYTPSLSTSPDLSGNILPKNVALLVDESAAPIMTRSSVQYMSSKTLKTRNISSWLSWARSSPSSFRGTLTARPVLEQASPDVVITTSRSDDQFMDIARAHMDASGGVFQIRPQKEFVPSKGRERLLSLRLLAHIPRSSLDLPASSDDDRDGVSVVSQTRNAYDFMRRRHEVRGGDPTVARWNACIRLSNYTAVESSPLSISCIGALLDYLVRDRAANDLEDEGIGGLEVRGIETLALDEVMHMNADALFSLQVFENESHASMHSDKTKEGLSLFGTLNHTKTTLGRALLRTWLLRPSLSLPVIKARHDAVACFLAAENVIPAFAMHGHLKGIKNVPRILEMMRSGKAKLCDWQGLVKLGEILDIASFRDVGNRINGIVDWEESACAGRVCVRPHIDEELDNRKHVYHGIDAVLSKVAEQVCETVPQDFTTCLNIVYFPQLGFLVCVPMLEAWKGPDGIQLIEGWTYQFSSDSHVYFKSQEMTDLDIHVGDLHPSIVDRELEIVQELLEEISVHFEAMAEACDVCAELDCLLSFAEASRTFDFRRPQMVEDNIIDIKQGRHPLQEQVVDTFVPNDAHLVGGSGNRSVLVGDETTLEEEEWNSIVLCTGANACGKSVYIKQVALIQYMAQIGCFVPAESATLGIVDKIFTRIATRESVSRVQSAFMIDLNQVSFALRNATSRSLILLDEFGKGTLSADGAGLFCGVLKYLLERGPHCPKVLAATHFHDVFREGLLDPDAVPITFLHMQVLFTANDGQILDSDASHGLVKPTLRSNASDNDDGSQKITYLYRVCEGLSLQSSAAKCAEIFGVPTRIVQRAEHVSHLISTHELGQLLDEEMTDAEREDLADAEAVCRRFLEWKLEGDGGGHVQARLGFVLGVDPAEAMS
ncbi:unnamed protein product [Mycena citricolor]|uniref:DNA mismatch repair proteins mutS family domain-containing protein n=1 Tax=Mycena citricolor TaxID=2018698 RepID=A0AAD2K812_9AGAR|nr:unnamed protein product [Mycena citricolor]